MPNNKNTYVQGFSLLEILTAITICMAITLIITPITKDIINRNHALVYANQLMTALQCARITAIQLGENIRLCKSKDLQTCGGSWQNGQIIVTEQGRIIRVFPPAFTGDKLIWHGNLGKQEAIAFSANGFPKGQHGSFHYCPRGAPENARAIVLNPSGRIYISNKTAKGETITCNS